MARRETAAAREASGTEAPSSAPPGVPSAAEESSVAIEMLQVRACLAIGVVAVCDMRGVTAFYCNVAVQAELEDTRAAKKER